MGGERAGVKIAFCGTAASHSGVGSPCFKPRGCFSHPCADRRPGAGVHSSAARCVDRGRVCGADGPSAAQVFALGCTGLRTAGRWSASKIAAVQLGGRTAEATGRTTSPQVGAMGRCGVRHHRCLVAGRFAASAAERHGPGGVITHAGCGTVRCIAAGDGHNCRSGRGVFDLP